MTNLELLKDKNIRRQAQKYFPSFFTDDLQIDSHKTIEMLDNQHDIYIYQYSFKFSGDIKFSNTYIDESYNYIRLFLVEQKRFQQNKNISERFINTYRKLFFAICQYGFISGKNTTGFYQNEANKHIIEYFRIMRPALSIAMDNVNKVLTFYDVPEEIDEFYIELILRLDALIKNMNYMYRSLMDAEREYKVISKAIQLKNGSTTYNQLGIARNNWRKDKNKACNLLFNMYQELKEINLGATYRTFNFEHFLKDYDECEVTEICNKGTQMIIEGPYAYCFIGANNKRTRK